MRICRHLHTGRTIGKSHLIYRSTKFFVGLFIRLKCKYPPASSCIMQQFCNGIAAVGTKIGKRFLRCRLDNIMVSFIGIGCTICKITKFAAEFKVYDIMQHLSGLLVCEHRFHLQKLLLMFLHKIHGKKVCSRYRNIRCYQFIFLRQFIEVVYCWLIMNRKRHHNQEIIIAALNIRKFFHLVAHEQITAGKTITCKHCSWCNPIPLHHLQNFDSTIPHSVHHNRFLGIL